MDARTLRGDAEAIWRAGVAAAAPERCLAATVRVEGTTLRAGRHAIDLAGVRTLGVVGAGKAGAGMARALEALLGPELLVGKRVHGLVAVPDEAIVPLARIELVGTRAGHVNRPTERGVAAARRVLGIAEALEAPDLLVALFSGGGSALLPAPVDAVPFADKLAVTARLQDAGASIAELNAVRKHLSRLKGGLLAQATRAGRVLGLLLSDVVGDALDVIASGPTAPDASTYADALGVLDRHGVSAPETVRVHLAAGAAGKAPETPADLPASVSNVVVGSNQTAIDGARERAAALGYSVVDLGTPDEPDVERTVRLLAGLARSIRERDEPVAPPACILCGGENVVDVGDAPGRGGRNLEAAALLLRELAAAGTSSVAAVCAGTDGEDGPTDAAGGVVDGEVLRAAADRLADVQAALGRHDTLPLLDSLGGVLRTGPTGTNVADLRVVVVGA